MNSWQKLTRLNKLHQIWLALPK